MPPKSPNRKKASVRYITMLQFKKYIDKMYILFIKSVLFRKFSVKAYLSECFGVSDHLSATKFILASSEQSISVKSVAKCLNNPSTSPGCWNQIRIEPYSSLHIEVQSTTKSLGYSMFLHKHVAIVNSRRSSHHPRKDQCQLIIFHKYYF